MNSEQLTEIDALRARVVELEQTLAGNVRLIEKYEDIIRRLAQRHWGRSSEKNPGQAELSLFEEAELVAMGDTPEDEHAHGDDAVSDGFDPSGPPETESGTVDAGAPASTVPPTRRRKRVLPDHLERVIVRHELDELQRQCPCGCAGQLMPIGEEVTEQLGVMPATHFVIQHVRVKYACPCKGAGVQTAPMPTALIPGSQASPALVAATMVGKYDWGSPLYRQERIARSFGLELPRSKLARWIIASVDHLRPLYNLMQDALLDYDIVLSDDTGIQVLKEDGRAPSTKSALWIRRGGAPGTPVVLVDYRQTKGLREARSLLEYCTGYLVCDGAPTFERAAELQGLTLVLCNDHARRKFVEAERDGKKAKTLGWIASKALGFYKKLYEIERKAKHLTPAQRLENRVRKAVPIWELFIAWATRIHSEGVRDLATRKALEYLIRHETGLRRYYEEGRLPISNILSEHVAKTVSISRKYFLFADTPAGAGSSAMAYSVIESAKANGQNALKYMTVVLDALPGVTSVDEVEALLPWRLTPKEVEARRGDAVAGNGPGGHCPHDGTGESRGEPRKTVLTLGVKPWVRCTAYGADRALDRGSSRARGRRLNGGELPTLKNIRKTSAFR